MCDEYSLLKIYLLVLAFHGGERMTRYFDSPWNSTSINAVTMHVQCSAPSSFSVAECIRTDQFDKQDFI
jgi:hypothetical protein